MPISQSAKWRLFRERREIEDLLISKVNIDRLVAKILINRGIDTPEEADKFLFSTLDDLNSPLLMNGMEMAVDRILKAVRNREKIVIFGDYDVDGMSSTSLLVKFFGQIGHPVTYYIPHRIDEGYGLNENAIANFRNEGASLLITVDCGVTSVKEVMFASELGLDVIITDHHQVSDELPPAYALLNPSRPDCKYPFKHLAGVGIAFKLVCAMRDMVVSQKLADGRAIANLNRDLDLVSLGTLADMVPLIGENHILVRFGLEEMAKSQKVGLRALMNLGNFGKRPVADTDIGFFIAPRLNAVGRLKNARMGVELLTTEDKFRAKEIARNMEEENAKRQDIQNKMLEEVLILAGKEVDFGKDKAIVLASSGWHLGVIGIVASRVVEKFNMPTVLLNIEDGICRGSARSVPSFHIYNGLNMCKDKLLHFGGHKYAAGLTLNAAMFEEFKAEFKNIAVSGISEEQSEPVIDIDAETEITTLDISMIEGIMELGPFGPQHPYPVFMTRSVSFVGEPHYMGKNGEHVRFEVGNESYTVDGVGFGLGPKFREIMKAGLIYDIIYTPTIITRNEMSREVQIRLQDISISEN